MRAYLLVLLAATGCSFSPGVASMSMADASPDGPPPVTLGFAKTMTAADEEVGSVAVRVVLSAPSDQPITVDCAVTGGSATQPADFVATDATLTFAPGDVEETFTVTINPDSIEEPEESIELTLSAVTGGAVLVSDAHTVTIAPNVLPRVTFSTGTSSALENASPTIDVVLDKASLLTTSVEIAVMGGTASAAGVDYTLTTTSVTFAPGEVTKPVTLTVVDDTADEDAETATIELANPTNVIIGATATRTHTITDNDDPPTVSFVLATSSASENVGFVDLTVQLSAASSKAITVPFAVNNAGTAVAADFAVPTASPLTFAAGTTQQTVRITVKQDSLIESPETVVIDLGAPTNAALAQTNTTHTFSIIDDDQTCLGTGAFATCFATPTATASLSGTLNTDTSGLCSTTPLSGWTGGPSTCFVVATTITVAATTVTGSKPLVLFASQNINVTGDLDVSSHLGGTAGPGAGIGCGAYTVIPVVTAAGAGGGAGGTFRTAGGAGGIGNNGTAAAGAPVAAGAAPTTLRGGCVGQRGGDGVSGGGNNGGTPGAGGGSVYLVTAGTITISTGVTINASGASGVALTTPDSGFFAGGGGGGSGGMIKLEATAFSVTGAKLMANGGGGSSGGDVDGAGTSGIDSLTSGPTAGGTGGPSGTGGGDGGRGFGSATPTTNGADQPVNNGGGGGGGGGGFIASNLTLTGATVSAGDIDP